MTTSNGRTAERAVEKLLPQNLEAEQGVLGSILIDPEALDEVSELLTPEMFYREAHRVVYAAALDLYARGIPADLITLVDELERSGKLGEIGGPSFVGALASQVPTSTNAVYYAQIVERTWVNRSLIKAAGQIAAVAYNEPDGTLGLEQAEQLLYEIAAGRRGGTRMVPIAVANQDVFERLDRDRSAPAGVTTGIKKVDELLGGGLQRSDLLILAARPGFGKTSLALSIGDEAAKKGHGVAIFSLEMSKEQLANRLISMEAGVDSQQLRNGYLGEAEVARVVDAIARVNGYPIYIDDTAMLSMTELRSRARRQMLHAPFDLLIVDYIQLMTAGDIGGRRGPENRQQEVSEISRGLKGLARELNVPVLALSQLSRAVESRADKKPMLSDLRESGSLEQDADVVAFIYREEMYNPETEMQHIANLIFAKHRNGPTGEVSLFFEASHTRYRGLEQHYASDAPMPSYPGYDRDWSTNDD